MSKSDLLGTSSAFDRYTGVSGRGRAIAGLTGEPLPPAAEPLSNRVPIGEVANNPYNPRPNPPAITDMADSIEQCGRILSALVVVRREAFLAVYPLAEAKLPADAKYVTIDGNRRLLGARQAGLDEVPIAVDDELAADEETLLQAILTADAQHEALDHLDAASALTQFVESKGSQRAAARALGKSQSWISKKLAVLNLHPDLQEELRAGRLPIDVAAKAGAVAVEEQFQSVETELRRRREKAEASSAAASSSSENSAEGQIPAARTANAAASAQRDGTAASSSLSDSARITSPANDGSTGTPEAQEEEGGTGDSRGITQADAHAPGGGPTGVPDGDSRGITSPDDGATETPDAAETRSAGDSRGITSADPGIDDVVGGWVRTSDPSVLAKMLVEHLSPDTVMDVMQMAVELLRQQGVK